MTTDGITSLTQVVRNIASQQLRTYEHSRNVAAYAVELAQRLGVPDSRIERLARAATFHDVGKAAIPEWILVKPGPLTDEERACVEEHSVIGEAMLEAAGFEEEATWVRAHHERFDGGGYPDGVAGESIPLESRIIFVADAFEVMTSDRPYRDGLPVHAALAELMRCAGTQFDPDVVHAMVELVIGGTVAVKALRASPS